ncbi:drug/metabolite transporter (DMT)-like permease [Sinobaca qinghaiensis]|uniref:Drug/metabolite transporter (DMT)-like permease n=1 Tax=Sinobaca qinghaiensis TaxID=342944 RepID=A0A419UWV2_9BACL|nr:DMT family transporter [Sinobaca qinghaiensis]RKD69622.1 drug/metabolite transporter (DMT)-like permease [Sinobaca qinghaiensis]
MTHPNKGTLFLAYIVTIFLWASAFPAIRVALTAFSPQHLSLLRLLIGSVVLVLVAACLRISLPKVRDWPVILVLGGLGFSVYHTALNIGEQTVEAGPASLLVSTTPLFAAFLVTAFFREKLGWMKWIGALISLGGIAMISLEGSGSSFTWQTGVWIILLAALAESVYFVFQHAYLTKYGVIPFTMYAIWAGTLWMLIFFPGLGQAIGEAPLEVTWVVVYLGVFPTVLPYFTLAYLTIHSGASEATSALYVTPVLSFLLAWIWLGETPTVVTLIGGGITLLGVYLSHSHFQKKTKSVPVYE